MPKLERGFSHVNLQNQYYPVPAHQRHNPSTRASTLQQGDIRGEMAAIVAARDAWTCFRCTPTIPSSSCPKTARLNLERLEQTLKNHDGWSTWSPQSDQNESANGDHLTVMQLHESTRDKLLAITQTFLHKALEIHRDGAVSPDNRNDSLASGVSNFVLLPPARVLEYFLRSYANCFERYYPLTSRGILDANELMHCFNDRAASLQVLMMIAQGAMNIPSVEARMLTGGLTEACRISLFDVIEKDINMAGDPIVLHSALIFAVQAAWSGDKWQMDIAMGQRGMYLAMLRHTGSLESRPNKSAHPSPHVPYVNTDYLWNEWLKNESRSRLVYSWAMVDQELALFHDMAPLFAVTEFSAPMPDADRLWHAKNAAEWSCVFEQVHEFSNGYPSVGSGIRPLSLRALFRHLLDEELLSMGIQLTPFHLRLLLHPLQSLVYQCKQLLSCFSDMPMERNSDGHSLTAFSTRNRLAEVQNLLKYWFGLAERYMDANPLCAMMQTNLIIFHLISLNVVTDFAVIEELARRHNTTSRDSSTDVGGLFSQSSKPFHNRCISDVEEAMYHCGQVLRAVRHLSQSVRPPWWAAAIYRVALTLWADAASPSNDNRRHPPPPEIMNIDVGRVIGSSSHSSSPPQQTSQQQQFRHQRSRSHNPEQFGSAAAAGMANGPCFAIDAVAVNDPHLLLCLTKGEGVPCLSRRDGSLLGIEDPAQVLTHCVDLIDIGAATRFSDGIKAKLERLAQGG